MFNTDFVRSVIFLLMISGYPIVFRKVFSSLSPPLKQSVYEEETGVGLRAEAGHLAGVATEGHGGPTWETGSFPHAWKQRVLWDSQWDLFIFEAENYKPYIWYYVPLVPIS